MITTVIRIEEARDGVFQPLDEIVTEWPGRAFAGMLAEEALPSAREIAREDAVLEFQRAGFRRDRNVERASELRPRVCLTNGAAAMSS